jgi:D-amino-acid dehydrogenase
MKIAIVGSGLIGIASAYFLRCRGYEVRVIDRKEGPGRETSFANGALLSPSMSEPWNAPGCWRVLLNSLSRSDAPLQLRYRTLPGLMSWGMTFLRNSSPTSYRRNTVSNLRLSLYSMEVLKTLRLETQIEYGATMRGALKLFRSTDALNVAANAADRLSAQGLRFRVLSRHATVEHEPALESIHDQLAGAIHYEAEETGDAYRFCVTLAEKARALGVEFTFGATVSGLEMSSGRVTGIRTPTGCVVADQYIVAAGSYSAPILRSLGLRLPVRPAKGYTVTFDSPHRVELKIPVVDDEMHAAIVPVGESIRVAGTAEFAGYNLALRPERIRNLVHHAQSLFPQSGLDARAARPWCGLRPMSSDGVPIIGPTPLDNLWINTGHGHLGWTMAAGSGKLIADLLSGESSSIDPLSYDLRRFGRG